MQDSIVVNMEYADYDLIDGTPNVERHHIFGGQIGTYQMKMDYGFR